MAMNKNVVIAQSGGPSPVINNSLRGIIETCQMFPDKFETIYGGFHGIEGVLKEELLDISAQRQEEVSLLRITPAAGTIGTCRYKLKEDQQEDFNRVIDVFKTHNVGYFFYIGGNDSMDTANKVALLAHQKGLDLVAVGSEEAFQHFEILAVDDRVATGELGIDRARGIGLQRSDGRRKGITFGFRLAEPAELEAFGFGHGLGVDQALEFVGVECPIVGEQVGHQCP